MPNRLLRAGIRAAATVVMIITINFVLFRVVPGDPATMLLSGARQSVSQNQIDALRKRWGLDRPLIPDQLVAYVGSTLQGDLGFSFRYGGEPVADLLLQRIPATILLVGVGQGLAIVAGVLLGCLAGWRRGSAIDRLVTNGSLVLYSAPQFWLGMVLVLAFSAGLHSLPPNQLQTPGRVYSDAVAQAADIAAHSALPVATVALGWIGQYVLVTRSAISDVLTEEYMVTAWAKGLSRRQLLFRHAFRNAMLPIATLITVNLGYIVAGAITVEAVFAWPGIGSLTAQAVIGRDYPVLQGIFLLLGVGIVVANLLSDVAYGFLDPRVRR
jgi:peptide/nickel transport system permease protein